MNGRLPLPGFEVVVAIVVGTVEPCPCSGVEVVVVELGDNVDDVAMLVEVSGEVLDEVSGTVLVVVDVDVLEVEVDVLDVEVLDVEVDELDVDVDVLEVEVDVLDVDVDVLEVEVEVEVEVDVLDVEVDVLDEEVDDFGQVVVVVVVGEHPYNVWLALAWPFGTPSKTHEAVAVTVCVPDGTVISIVSVAVGPTNVTSCCATTAPSSDTTSSEVALTPDGKLEYENTTSVHEIEIELLCADAVVTNNDTQNALSNSGKPRPIPTMPRMRRFRSGYWRLNCS